MFDSGKYELTEVSNVNEMEGRKYKVNRWIHILFDSKDNMNRMCIRMYSFEIHVHISPY